MDITIHYELEGNTLRFPFKTISESGDELHFCCYKDVDDPSSLSDIDIIAFFVLQAAQAAEVLNIERSELVSITAEEYDAVN